ncbi:23S rRNA (uracil(1939)-C(5))-methyltransferase RlmD [Noviherbaspirillum sedimenti]|uniref:23S rRNA (uracil(1939)-C(5))-methyltransferase RlmD n=1 Tax=Noviherbaspirillum sedimenti TaxID=2320865 RepID=A0A3A3FXX8_9BURK|nr:23S rRNA (uracil(1939)-C(5))-methyltransferase RlmD [Noviherbaspirillum sedimenti]RJG00471.1 23S rRNA (uracil(1939)-C(5))-methyltransferase RlmD [Noviherbaspirillum sedimenti]
MQSNIIEIESLDMEGRGVGHLANEDGTPGKVIFVEGALPGERVTYQTFRKKPKWEAATMVELLRESSLRVKPKCQYFGICGGCSMQHLEPAAQVAIKQRVLEDNLKHLGKVQASMMLRPIYGPTWGYRFRARISVKNVVKKGGVLVGFHERRSSFVADMKTCDILPPNVSALLVPLRGLVASLSIPEGIPQLELAVGAGEHENVTVLVMRNMAPLTADDEAKLKAFADQHAIHWWLQPKGPDTAYPFYPADSQLEYVLPEFGIHMPFRPTDFTQVNHQINRVLVSRALRLLDVQPQDRVADLFCGIGNFTLPLATQAREVMGIEGSTALTERALQNAEFNGLAARTTFQCRNLFEISAEDVAALGKFDRMLVDPPREGAHALSLALAELARTQPDMLPKRIVYVSCNPATLARDAGILVHEAGYVLQKAGVVNMFPHTAHVESIAVFDLPERHWRLPEA